MNARIASKDRWLSHRDSVDRQVRNAIHCLGRQSQTFWIGTGCLFVLLVGILDYQTEPEPLIFYLIPVLLVAWFAGRRAGVLMSVASSAVWLTAALMKSSFAVHPFLPYWSVLMRMTIFLTVTYILSAMMTAKRRQEEMMQFIVHDLRSPLTNIQTGLLTLQHLYQDKMDETQEELVDRALISSKWMMALVNSLLDMGRLETGQMPLQLLEVDPTRLVESAVAQVALWADQDSVSLEPQIASAGLMVRADPVLTERVLVNLLSNARKFSSPCSVITIRVTPFQGNTLAFSVIDEGPGIPRQWASSRVFDKFAQVHRHTTDGVIGTGVGLTFCQLAVRAQGGDIWIQSEEGKGTAVTFTLPITDLDRQRQLTERV